MIIIDSVMAFWDGLKWFLNKVMDVLAYVLPVAFILAMVCSVIGIILVILFMHSALSPNRKNDDEYY